MQNTLAKNAKQSCQTTDGCKTEGTSRTFRPHADVADLGNEVVLWMDVPGADEDRIDVSIEGDELTVHAHVTVEDTLPEEERKFGRREYAVGDYVRTFRLGQEVDRSAIDATIADGVLKLTLPKVESAVSQRIEVKTR